ncbi:hypothetical protein Thimo_3385 [Thioflavicoccus mobilis 8321]|uniref:Curlin associated repeat-containing protein n=1 Tax=Thioflavicoccus mobilis 8321 TaxID=765912 RepID=L0H327_9GAMM|nr:hypothetical protein [Thioflavicoccus mobilis]AGA92055.1 hypothetical protein Thimo_3385 [Thioflavicoccus mobilis 8321]
MKTNRLLALMLAMTALASPVQVAAGGWGSDLLPPQTVIDQSSKLNIAVVVVAGEGDSSLQVGQTGDRNVALTKQYKEGIDQLVSQQKGAGNVLSVHQQGEQNLVVATQDDQGSGKHRGGTSYSRTLGPDGLEVQFRSGDFDFFSLTVNGAFSTFGRVH